MTNKEMQQHINTTAAAVRKSHKETAPKGEKVIEINTGLPYVAVDLPNGESYFFQGEEASNLLDEANAAADKFDTNVEDTILWMAQGW